MPSICYDKAKTKYFTLIYTHTQYIIYNIQIHILYVCVYLCKLIQISILCCSLHL